VEQKPLGFMILKYHIPRGECFMMLKYHIPRGKINYTTKNKIKIGFQNMALNNPVSEFQKGKLKILDK